MVTKPKANSIITHALLDGGIIQFTVKGEGELTFDPTKAHQNNRLHAELHGWIQRISDAAAISRDPETGLPATPAMKKARMEALRDHYESGSEEWSRAGKGGLGKSLTIEAIARVKGCTYDEAEAYVDEYAKRNYEGDRAECLAFLRTGERVMRAMEAIRTERAPKPKIDADNALDELVATPAAQ